MKKMISIVIVVSYAFLLSSCDFNGPLRNKMLDYYNKDDNYIELEGLVKNIEHHKDWDELVVQIEILTEEHQIPYINETNICEFVIVNWSKYSFKLEVDDCVVFVSAPYYFYNGHILPIVSLQQGECDCLSFEDGKGNYIDWIKDTFK